MKNFSLTVKIIVIYLFLFSGGLTKESKYFNEGVELFQNKKFDKSKIFFERDIVFNPKSELSYMYLAKIFNENENDEEQERNLNSVLLLNPKNDEAIYMLTLLKIKQSNYSVAKQLIEEFDLICDLFCKKNTEMKSKLKKIIPENEENNN